MVIGEIGDDNLRPFRTAPVPCRVHPEICLQAYMWLNLTAMGASPGEDRNAAVRVRDIIEKRMSLAEVAEAQKLVREWWEKHQKAE